MTRRLLALTLLFLVTYTSFSQGLDIATLDEYFETLERRNEAMGNISISKNGSLIYSKAIGHRYLKGEKKVAADTSTNYRIWSITKLYTATMIMQLVEEGKLMLDTKLDQFYPEIPNASKISIKHMLHHKSGIHDFIQNDSAEDWDTYITEPKTQRLMVEIIAQYQPDFDPNEAFGYSNSNYLLLGYIIEKLDGNRYETSLLNRIVSKLELKSTYFGVGALDNVENKAFTYKYKKKWLPIEEGEFSGLVPAGAGGIVSTTSDMNSFIHGLYSGKLVSKNSLEVMMPRNEGYGLGMMSTSFEDLKGYGHTGGFIASESSLFYYPEDSLSVAFATNGFVIRKEEILENVLKIYHKQPFGISMNRSLQTLLILALCCIGIIVIKVNFNHLLETDNLLFLGYIIPVLFWIGTFIAGHLYGDYSSVRNGVTVLDSYYSASGTFMSGIQIMTAFLLAPYIYSIHKSTRSLKLSILPLIPLYILPISLVGSSLFPYPNTLYQIFINSILIIILSPLAAIVLWRKKEWSKLKWYALVSLTLMLFSILLIISRPKIPVVVNNYWGLLQRAFYIGWTLWVVLLGHFFINFKKLKMINE